MTLWPSVYRGSGSLPTRFTSPVKGLPVSSAGQRALREAVALTSGRISLSLKGGCKTPSRQYPLSGTSQGICVSLSQSPPDPCSKLSFSSCNQLDLICIIRPLGTMHAAWLPPCLAGSSLRGTRKRREAVTARSWECPFPHAARQTGDREVRGEPLFPFQNPGIKALLGFTHGFLLCIAV